MMRHSNLRNGSLASRIAERQEHLFAPRPDLPELEVSVPVTADEDLENDTDASVEGWVQVSDADNLQRIQQETQGRRNINQVFLIRQNRSWSPLNISRKLFESLLEGLDAFESIWDTILPFGFKRTENELEFPNIELRHHRNSTGGMTYTQHEIAYVLRNVELNHRASSFCPWSIRQMGVYQKLMPQGGRDCDAQRKGLHVPSSTFIFTGNTDVIKKTLHRVNGGGCGQTVADMLQSHDMFVHESLTNWTAYMSWLQDQLEKQYKGVAIRAPQTSSSEQTYLNHFHQCFEDRQLLRKLEAMTIDLQIILANMQGVATGLLRFCGVLRSTHESDERKDEVLQLSILAANFANASEKLKSLQHRAVSLREVLASTTSILNDLVAYEEAAATRTMQRDTHEVTEKSYRDAAAVKALTIISLVYLPTTIVANFFSTEFVKSDESGKLQVTPEAWLLAAIAVPMTAITIALWLGWVRFVRTGRKTFLRHTGRRTPDKDLESGLVQTGVAPAHDLPSPVTFSTQTTLRSARMSELQVSEAGPKYARPPKWADTIRARWATPLDKVKRVRCNLISSPAVIVPEARGKRRLDQLTNMPTVDLKA